MNEIITAEVKKLQPLGACEPNNRFLIYSTTIQESPHVVIEIAKKRAEAFSEAGVVINNPDLDSYDVCGQYPQSQMFIWDALNHAVVGGYRYSYNDVIPPQHSPMGSSFDFTQEFKNQNWIQLGRSFLVKEYRARGIAYLLKGLGCLFAKANNPEGFFGKVTIPKSYEENRATDFIAAFCKHQWIDGSRLGLVKKEYARKVSSLADFSMSHISLDGDHKEFINLLKKEYQMSGIPILKVYDSLSSGFDSIHYLGAFVHKDFGGSTEIGMAIHKNNISSKAKKAYIDPYL